MTPTTATSQLEDRTARALLDLADMLGPSRAIGGPA